MNRKFNIVVADDDSSDLELLQLAVERSGVPANVHEVRDGQEAIEYLEGANPFTDRQLHPFPDLLILDLKMPRMDGFQVLDWLRAHPDCGQLPVVMLSSSSLERDVEEAYRRGANTFFTKPMDYGKFSDLVRLMIHYWIQSQRPVSTARS